MRKAFTQLRSLMKGWFSADKGTRTALIAAVSMLANIFFGCAKLVLGFFLLSPWFVINAIYYIVLGIARGTALRYCGNDSDTANQSKEETACKRGGFLLVLLGVCYLLISIRMFFREEFVHYSGYTVFVVTLMTLSKILTSTSGLIAYRKTAEPILSLIRKYNFADACVSLVSVRCALLMIAQAPNAIRNSAIFGIVTSGVLVVLGSTSIYPQASRR